MEEHKSLIFFRKHWKNGIYALLILGCIGVWTERLFLKKRGNSSQDFLIVNQIIERYQMGNPIALESLEVAERIVKKHPELHPKLDTMLSHVCYFQNDPLKAASYATASLKRVRLELPTPYVTFSEVTLDIKSENYEKAFTRSCALHQQLAEDPSFAQLHAFNLLRLIFLSDRTGHEEEKPLYISQLKKLAAYDSIESLFKEGALNLENYLASK
ncbi:MAG: hypothetical protein S4CHLAM45_12070 [Chlamydiales bacterium]|nr:hypothetical protein [Chlamydiales bacterium]MCH9619696.1 hypothetical protein [Chlamydiales bacterium]MCH9623302.1 hypothetical protein [Chlamydiales bacterium]